MCYYQRRDREEIDKRVLRRCKSRGDGRIKEMDKSSRWTGRGVEQVEAIEKSIRWTSLGDEQVRAMESLDYRKIRRLKDERLSRDRVQDVEEMKKSRRGEKGEEPRPLRRWEPKRRVIARGKKELLRMQSSEAIQSVLKV